MIDFSCAVYLGLRHASHDLRPWAQLTRGAPAVLAEPPAALRIATSLAMLTRIESATLARSTLHAFWDLFGDLTPEPGMVLMDAGAYPIARWGAVRAILGGVPWRLFRHHDPESLRRLMAASPPGRARPWIVTDGFCPGCSRPAPLAEYLRLVRIHGGRLVIDDTQALGVLGSRPEPDAPFGRGGGGSLRAAGLQGPDVLVVSSLAKGFGVPLAFIGGPQSAIQRLAMRGETRIHSSPPSHADLSAAEHALDLNSTLGEERRRRLANLVGRFRTGLRRLGLVVSPIPFPVLRLEELTSSAALALYRHLTQAGIRAVLSRPSCARTVGLSFLLTARHDAAQIDCALRVLEAHARPLAATRLDSIAGAMLPVRGSVAMTTRAWPETEVTA